MIFLAIKHYMVWNYGFYLGCQNLIEINIVHEDNQKQFTTFSIQDCELQNDIFPSIQNTSHFNLF